MVLLWCHVLHPWSPSMIGLWNEIKFVLSCLLQLQGTNPFTCQFPLVIPFFCGKRVHCSALRIGNFPTITCLIVKLPPQSYQI